MKVQGGINEAAHATAAATALCKEDDEEEQEDGVNVTANSLHPGVINTNPACDGGFFDRSMEIRYDVIISFLSSRKDLCVNEDVVSKESRDSIDAGCMKLLASWVSFAKQYQLALTEPFGRIAGSILHLDPLFFVDSVVSELLGEEIRLKSLDDQKIFSIIIINTISSFVSVSTPASSDEELEGDSDTEAIPDSIFDDASIHINAENASVEKQKTHSEDPFNIYKLLTKNKENNHKEFNLEDSERLNNIQEEVLKDKFNEDAAESTCSGHFKKSNISRTGGSILQVMEEMVKETKMENIDLFSIKRCWGNLAFDYAHSASVGNSGGILCVWDPKSFSKLNATISDYFVMVRGDWIPNGTKLLIISIYAPQDLSEKKMLWDYLSHVIAQWAGEVVVMGDFNEVRKKDERFGSVFNVHGANAFNLFISNAGLEEVPLGGCSYTWCHKSASKMSKLDRFLISESLMNSCPNISAITLERFLSDHRPILMRESHYDYGPVPFRFFHYWFEIKGFDKFVEDSWKEAVVVEPNAMTKLMKKLKHLKEKIRLWNKGNTMSSINRKRTLKSDLADLDLIIDKGWGNVEIVNKRANVVRSLQELENLQSLEAAQKSKIKWAIEGDENSKYYHGILHKKRSQLAIRDILVDGNWIDSPHLPDQIIDLECDVSKYEIKRVVWDCGTDKSHGLDGFTFDFYRHYWNFLESDVVDAVTSFFHHGQFPKGSNSLFIALILKTRDANMVKDFRPISLIGSMYKIIAKILVNRLVLVLGDLVNEVQSAFIADRQILDGPFILNEIVQWGSVIVNGSPTEEFQFHKGLKQGDPLSPFLFILVMETLHISFQRIVNAGMFKGIMLSPYLQLSHLFYVDDVIFMGQWNESNLDMIAQVLECFHHASGLRLNMSKSKLMRIYVDANKVAQAARKIGCVTLKTPFTYLGSKVGGHMSRIQSWNETIEAMASRLSKWKMKTLSIGGRLTLLKSVLGSMPIYHMSIFKVPMKILQRMESIRSHFFNGSDPLAKKPTWVKWTNVLASKEKGGLGISSLYALNRALMFKWVWRFLSQNSSLWANVIKSIHGDHGKIGKQVKVSYPSIWLDIVKEVDLLKKRGLNLLSFVNKKVGNGSDTLFWEETWHGDVAFKFLFPRAYALESCKNIDVASKLSQNSLAFTFRREPRGGVEQDQFDSLKAMVEGTSLVNIRDRWIWSLQSSGDFTVASIRKLIDEFTLSEVSSSTRWIKAVPIKVNVLAWKIKLDNLPTRLNISRRGMDIDSILCPTCGKAVESTRHIFFTCQIARDILHLITSWWNIPYMEVSSYEEWLIDLNKEIIEQENELESDGNDDLPEVADPEIL
ncbi:RNA-directed DNA polymerase, eukaryota, reverse transcriptase zinc-binding domain protein [Tanacetum coccineum]